MAKMYPEWISDEHRRANPRLRAEFTVYDLLSQGLPDDWLVFYNRTWTWVENRSRLRTRESDFILAHAMYGILLVEVKGGRIEVKDGKWLSTDRYGDTWDINPYEQVAIAAAALERRLNEEHRGLFDQRHFATCVCFPDVAVPSDTPGFNANLQRVTIDANALRDNLASTIKNILRASGDFSSPGEARVMILKELVACSWHIHAPKSIQVYDTEMEIKRLTEQQFNLLYLVAPNTKKLLVAGCAGSGKTMLAAEVGRRLSYLDKKRVLFTCYNRNLANWLSTSSFFKSNPLALVANYHQLCARFAKAAGLTLPDVLKSPPPDSDPVFANEYPELLFEVAAKAGEPFDAIIVDEGQDFVASWWPPLQLLLKENGVFHVYFDSRQRLRGTPEELPPDITDGATFLNLTENVRNTRSIYDLVMKFHLSRGSGFKSLCEIGPEPEFVAIRPGQKEPQAVREVLEKLVNVEGILPRDIAILTPLSLVTGNSAWRPDDTLIGKWRLVHHLHPGTNELFCSSIRSAKGLEFPVVILTELCSPAVESEVPDIGATLYVGVSRARSHVVIMSDRDAFGRLCPN